MATGGGGLRSLIKEKIKNSAIGETVSGKIHSIMKHDQHAENASPVSEPQFHFIPSHGRTESLDSTLSDQGVSEEVLAPPTGESERRRPSNDGGDGGNGSVGQPADIYEQQLTQLQEQLVSSMIENQNLAAELDLIKNNKQVQKMEQELAQEKRRNNELLSKMADMAHRAARTQDAPAVPVETRAENLVDATDDSTSEVESTHSWVDRVVYSLLQQYYQLAEDFSVTSDDVVAEEVSESLSVKTLKLNVKRFGSAISPIFDTMSSLYLLFNWHSPLLTGTVFLTYMYVCWTGFLLPAVFFVLVLRLFLNLLEEWKVIPAINLLPAVAKPEPEKEKETSVSDKFNIVLDVATKVQNKLGQMADGLEKLKNFLTWKRAEDTKQLFLPLCGALLVSLFLSMDTLVFLLGILLGLKLFVINPVYDRFPRVKDRYDGTSRLWKNLVTDAELEKQNRLNANNQMVLPRQSPSHRPSERSRQSSSMSLLSTGDFTMSVEDREFCDRFNLPDEERPVTYPTPFKGGRSCIYMEKNAALKLSTAYNKHTKLYLTPSFLCYELVRQDVHRAIPLANITRIEKRKPLSILPGNGMALEVVEQGFDKPHVFGGVLHRDECYNVLMDIGRTNGLQYAESHDTLSAEVRLSELTDTEESLVAETLITNDI